MTRDFSQHRWTSSLQKTTDRLIRLALEEDQRDLGDLTSLALVPDMARGEASVVARQIGVVAGLAAVPTVLTVVDSRLRWKPVRRDGDAVQAGTVLGVIVGPVRTMLGAERLLLNLVGHLSGVATQTAQYVLAVAGSTAKIYDTRKTTPGLRDLEKYSVVCGGGRNHRAGLFDAILIKDNHLAALHESGATPREGVLRAKKWLAEKFGGRSSTRPLVEVEVDSLDQLADVLPARPDLVLLDNMKPPMLKKAVDLRDAVDPRIELEASGGVNLRTVGKIAAAGVDRISVGALTHSAPALDIGLDWG